MDNSLEILRAFHLWVTTPDCYNICSQLIHYGLSLVKCCLSRGIVANALNLQNQMLGGILSPTNALFSPSMCYTLLDIGTSLC